MSLRPIAALALAFGLVTCSEASTAPGRLGHGAARFALAPRFTALADAAAASGEAPFDSVRIIITRLPSTVLLDTAVKFAPGDADLSLQLAVDAQANEQLQAELQYRHGTTVVYDGKTTVIAKLGDDAGGTHAQDITVDYVGPGATATKISVSPDTGNLSTSGSLQLSARVTDDTGKVFADTPVGWTTSDSSVATVNGAGLVTGAGKRGTARIIATTPTGLTASAVLHFTPPPSRIFIVSGVGQQGAVGSTLAQAVVVEVDGADSLPVPGQFVFFSASGGRLDADSATTDSTGRVQAHLTLGDTVGTAVFMARVATLTATATATVTPGAPASLVVNQTPANPPAGSAVTLQAHFVDKFANAVPQSGSKLTWSGGTGGSFSATATTTDSTGAASTQFTLGPKAGMKYEIHVTDGTLSGIINVTAAPAGAPAKVLLLDPQTLKPLSSPVSFTVVQQADAPGGVPIAQVVDSSGVGIPLASLTVTIASATTTLFTTTVAADSLGRFALDAIDPQGVFQVPGSYTVSLTSTGITTPTTIPVTIVAATLTKLAGDNQSGTAGQALAVQPTVLVTDPQGNPASGVGVQFAVASGGGHLADSSPARTDANGRATSPTWTLGSTVGAQTLTASVEHGPSVTFSATAAAAPGSAYKLAVVVPASGVSVTSGVTIANPVTIQVQDVNGAAANTSVKITATVSSGFRLAGGVSEPSSTASGTANFGDLHIVGSGKADVTFSAEGLQPAVLSVMVNPGPAAVLTLRGTASDSIAFDQGTLPSPVPNVRVADSTDVAVPGYWVHLTVSAGATTLVVDSAQTQLDGTVELPLSKIYQTTAGTYDVVASGAGLTGSPIHLKVTVRAATQSSLTVLSAPTAWTNASTPSTTLSAKLVDGSNVAVPGATIVAKATRVSGSGSLKLADSVATTNSDGIASFGSLRVVGTVGDFTLTFSASGIAASKTTGSISLVAGAATQMSASTALTLVQPQGAALVDDANLPAVALADTSGNAVSGVTPSWNTALPCYGTVTLGSAHASGSNGVAKSPSIAIPSQLAGSCGITAHFTHGSRSDSVSFSLAVVASSTLVYTGNSKQDRSKWSDPDNWSGHKLPGATDRVMINSSVSAKGEPILDVDASVGSLTLESGGSMELNGHNLTVAGNLEGFDNLENGIFGTIGGAGTVTLTGGSGSTVNAYMPDAHLIVGSGNSCSGTGYTMTASSILWVRQSTVNCPLDISSGWFFGTGNFETQGSGTISLAGSGIFTVAADTGSANVTFNGGDESGLITGGIMAMTGDFTQKGHNRSFVSGDSALVGFFSLDSAAVQHITFEDPGVRASRFGMLDIENLGGGGVVGTSNIFADSLYLYGKLSMQSGTTITAGTAFLDDGSEINGPGTAAFSQCFAGDSVTVNIATALGPLSCVSLDLSDDAARSRGGALLELRPNKGGGLPALPTSRSRQAACATLRRSSRLPARIAQAVCPQ